MDKAKRLQAKMPIDSIIKALIVQPQNPKDLEAQIRYNKFNLILTYLNSWI